MNTLNIFGKHHYHFAWSLRIWRRNIKIFFKSFKMAYQRIRYGFCDWDWFDLDHYYCQLIAASLKTIARKAVSHPYDVSYEEWTARLRGLADRFEALQQDELDFIPYDMDTQKDAYLDCLKTFGEKRKQYIQDTLKELAEVWDDLWD